MLRWFIMRFFVYLFIFLFLILGLHFSFSKYNIDRNEIIKYTQNNEPLNASYENHSLFYNYKNWGILKTKNNHEVIRYSIMKYFLKNNIKNIKHYYDFFTYKEENYLISNYISGEVMNAENTNYKQLKQLFHSLYKMDKILYFNRDLGTSNIIVNKSNIYFIDLDYARYIDNEGNLQFVNQTNDFCENVDNCLLKYLSKNTFYEDTVNPYYDIYLPIPSNIHNFEFMSLYKLIEGKEKKDPKSLFFSNYLQEKAKYHKKRYLQYSKVFKKADKSKIKDLEKLKRGLKIENAFSNVLSLGDNNVYNIEYKKIQIKTHSYLYQNIHLSSKDILKYKIQMDKSIKKLFDEIEVNLTELKCSGKLNSDMSLYVEAQKEWINHWKGYNNELLKYKVEKRGEITLYINQLNNQIVAIKNKKGKIIRLYTL